jgi:hypothetical protein
MTDTQVCYVAPYMWFDRTFVMTDTHTTPEVGYVDSYMWFVEELLMTVMWPLICSVMESL